ncbi:acetolactate synthase catalytic subunit [Salinisphaera dokdonensis CL-ES53]|uniref:Acetolactate synthase catalytic subunit n=1 Tax=Salinisphaera dokdonensis CL-ES53 TaxID=1304272 RepID=A0ABV2B2X3_9GAMM
MDGSASEQKSGAQRLAAALSRHGVTEIFGQSIPSKLFLAAPDYGMRQIGYRTENAGAAMADAYARASNRVGVVAAQNGPAATLLVAGLAEALTASTPLVAIVQDVARPNTDRNAFQELDHLELFKGVSKWTRRINRAERIEDYVDMAFTAAASGRGGPAVLLVPVDVLDEISEPARVARSAELGRFPLDRTVAAPAQVEVAARALASAERPVIIAGGGIHASQAIDELSAIQEHGFPVATTAMGKGAIDEQHPLSIGVVGYFMARRGRTAALRALVSEADVVLLIGNRTNQNGTDSWSLYPANAKYIHLDIDGQEVGRNYESIRLVGDAKLTLAALDDALDRQDLGERERARASLESTIADARKAWHEDLEALVDYDARPIRPERLMRDADALLTSDMLVVADASYASIWVSNFLTCKKRGSRFITPRGLAGLGWGLPFALGVKAARPECPVFCLTGDGGFGHVWAELETARRMQLPVVITVLNNQILGYQKHSEQVLHGRYTDVCEFTAVDHAAIARACGCNGVRIEDPADYGPALEQALATDSVTVLDVVTDERAYPPITGFAGSDNLDEKF